MAKSAMFFQGSNSYGKKVELAQSINGGWYTREYGFNGYAMGWSKWAACEVEEHTLIVYADVTPMGFTRATIECGFSKLSGFIGDAKVRLPA